LSFDKIKPFIKLSKSSVHLLYVNIQAYFRASSAVTCGMNAFVKGNEDLTFRQHIFNNSEVEKGMIAFLSTQHIKLDYSPYR
jgi:Fe-S oxidoreductase